MKPIRPLSLTVSLTAAVLSLAGCASAPRGGGGTTTVEFVAPEKFTDFEPSNGSGHQASEADLKQFEQILLRLGERHVPPGHALHLQITDVNRAGWIPPTALRRIRVIDDSKPASAEFDYTLRDAGGATVKQGTERLLIAYPQFPRDGRSSGSLEDLDELFRGWFKKLGRSIPVPAT